MTENQRKWLMDLQKKGVMFEMDFSNEEWCGNRCDFSLHRSKYRFPAQPIPDIKDWREVCLDMQSKGVLFYYYAGTMIGWSNGEKVGFYDPFGRSEYRIPAQPIPEWKEEPHPIQSMDALQDRPEIPAKALPEKSFSMRRGKEMNELKEELDKIPHRDLQIQWHEDMLHHLRTGEPMWEWEFKNLYGDWVQCIPKWKSTIEYRRKPRMKKVTYWHCVGKCTDNGGKEDNVYLISGDLEDLEKEVTRNRKMYTTAKFSTITETIVEIPED